MASRSYLRHQENSFLGETKFPSRNFLQTTNRKKQTMNIAINTFGYTLAVCACVALVWVLPRAIWMVFTLDVTQPYELTDDPVGAYVEVVELLEDGLGDTFYTIYVSVDESNINNLVGSNLHTNWFIYNILEWRY